MISSFRQCGRAVMLVALLTSPGWCAESRLKIEAGSHDRGPAPGRCHVAGRHGEARQARTGFHPRWRSSLAGATGGSRGADGGVRVAAPPRRPERRLSAGARPASSSAPAVEARVQGGAIMVSLRGSPVLRYNTAVVKPPPGIDAVYRRSGHIHPVYSRRAEFAVELRHSDLSAPGGAKPVLKEIWRVRTWNVAEGHLFDLESRQTCIADSRWS